METFVPIEREYNHSKTNASNSNTPNIDPMMVRRCRQVAKILSKNSKLRNWYETPEALLADDNRSVTSGHSKRSFFSRNPFANRGKMPGANQDNFETGSQQSGSTTASFLAPVNVGEQVNIGQLLDEVDYACILRAAQQERSGLPLCIS